MTSKLRFTHAEAGEARYLNRVSIEATWAWALERAQDALPDGRVEYRVQVSGLSRAGGLVAYGSELVQLLRAFHSRVVDIDPDAETETLSVRL